MSIQPISSGPFAYAGTNAVSQRPVTPVGAAGVSDSTPEPAQTSPALSQSEQRAAVEDAAKTVEKFVAASNNNLSFSVDNDTDKLVVKVMDRSTNEVIRQFPSEEMLQLSKSLDKLQGLLLKNSA